MQIRISFRKFVKGMKKVYKILFPVIPGAGSNNMGLSNRQVFSKGTLYYRLIAKSHDTSEMITKVHEGETIIQSKYLVRLTPYLFTKYSMLFNPISSNFTLFLSNYAKKWG